MQIVKRIFVVLASISVLSITFAPAMAFAAPAPDPGSSSKAAVCAGLDATGTTGCKATGPTVESVLKIAINLLSLVAGIAAVIMLIVAGIRYITSGGDSSGVKGAKEAIIYAIVGLIVVALSQSIVALVINRSTTTLPACPAGRTTLPNGKACQ